MHHRHHETLTRLRTLGIDALAAREVLALLLGTGDGSAAALALADALLDRFGSAAAIGRARPEEIARVRGVGPARAAAIVAAFQLARLAAAPDLDAVVVRRPADVAAVAWPRLAGLMRERMLVLVCDAGNRLRHVETVAMGGIDRCPALTREILNAVLRADGCALAVAHNHPQGDPRPSDADVECTIQLAAAAEVVGLRFLHHVVITDSAWRAVGTTAIHRLSRERPLVARRPSHH